MKIAINKKYSIDMNDFSFLYLKIISNIFIDICNEKVKTEKK
jgi:hypothetical protein